MSSYRAKQYSSLIFFRQIFERPERIFDRVVFLPNTITTKELMLFTLVWLSWSTFKLKFQSSLVPYEGRLTRISSRQLWFPKIGLFGGNLPEHLFATTSSWPLTYSKKQSISIGIRNYYNNLFQKFFLIIIAIAINFEKVIGYFICDKGMYWFGKLHKNSIF